MVQKNYQAVVAFPDGICETEWLVENWIDQGEPRLHHTAVLSYIMPDKLHGAIIKYNLKLSGVSWGSIIHGISGVKLDIFQV